MCLQLSTRIEEKGTSSTSAISEVPDFNFRWLLTRSQKKNWVHLKTRCPYGRSKMHRAMVGFILHTLGEDRDVV